MLKKRVVSVITGIILMLAVAGASGVVADSLGFEFTPTVQACSGGSGGNC